MQASGLLHDVCSLQASGLLHDAVVRPTRSLCSLQASGLLHDAVVRPALVTVRMPVILHFKLMIEK